MVKYKIENEYRYKELDQLKKSDLIKRVMKLEQADELRENILNDTNKLLDFYKRKWVLNSRITKVILNEIDSMGPFTTN